MLNYLGQGGLVDTGWQVTIVVEIWPVFHSVSPDRSLAGILPSPTSRCQLGLVVASAPFALDQPQAQPLKVSRRQLVEGQGVGCAGDRRLGLGQGFTSYKGHAQAGM